jgi:FkbM family methyltransferase
LAGTIAVVYVRKEYGDVGGFQTIVDIGANIGCFMLYAAQLNPNGKIYCFEPERKNFAVLNRNIELNDLTHRVAAYQLAVADTVGTAKMNLGMSPLHSLYGPRESSQQEVMCTTLMKLMNDNSIEIIDLLKLNCEGAEYDILGRCPAGVFARINNIRLEYHKRQNIERDARYLITLLKGQGFAIQRVTQYKHESGFIWASRMQG